MIDDMAISFQNTVREEQLTRKRLNLNVAYQKKLQEQRRPPLSYDCT